MTFLKKILSRTKLDKTLHLMPGDTLHVTHIDTGTETVLATHTLDASQAMQVDEAVLFEGEFEGRRALGGMVLEKSR